MNLDPKPIVDAEEPVVAQTVVDEPAGIPVTDEFVAQVTAMTPGEITADQIRTTIAAINLATTGDPIGTVRLGANGELAQRINLNGVPMWRITTPDGQFWNDMQPTLDWPQLGGN